MHAFHIVILTFFFIWTSCKSDQQSIGERIHGTWQLEKWTTTLADGTVVHPFGQEAYGKLIYDEFGQMTALFMADNRELMSSADIRERKPEEALEAFNTFFAYAGPYSIDQDSSFVLHKVEACSNPNWVGRTQKRQFKFEKDKLILSTPPIAVEGSGNQASSQILIWRPWSSD